MIVGLGNPGPTYAGTRHNVGFNVIELLAERARIRLNQRKHQAVFDVVPVNGVPCVLVKPMTFMNLSGQAVAPLLRSYNLGPEHLIVIADELDLEVGDAKFTASGGAGGHNGHRSLIGSLGTKEYARIKIGIGKGGDETVNHVLGRFSPEEQHTLNDVVARVAHAIEVAAVSGLAKGIEELNRQRP